MSVRHATFAIQRKKSPSREGGTIVFVDESGFSLLPMLVRPG
jgi:hypothetical protein